MISLVVTVLNEEQSILDLLKSISSQTKRPDEVIIVDGGSNDGTFEQLKKFKQKSKLKLRLFREKLNRPKGRNFGIDKAKGPIIAITDAGCILDKRWVSEIVKPFKDEEVEVVSGYYKAKGGNTFEKCVAVYTLVMPDRIDAKNFLPSARSMAIRKYVWMKIGGFPNNFPFNEDYVFANKLKKYGSKFFFTRRAIVYWKPRENLLKALLMFYYFALGDSMSGILRPKVLLIYIRYFFFLWILAISYVLSPVFMLKIFSYILLMYIIWAVWKNYKYVQRQGAFIFLPLLQILSDLTIILGTSVGFFKGVWDTKDRL